MNDTTFQGDGKIAYVPVVVNAKPPKQTNADRIRSTKTEEELMKAIFHALNMSRQYTDSRLGMVEWLKDARWGYPTLEEQTWKSK